MAESLHPSATHHLPRFVTAPGETDTLFVAMAIFVLLAVIGIGVFYFKLHALPEQLAHRGQKVQFQIVAVLALLALFTHNHAFWIAALLLALVPLPDLTTPVSSIADSLRRIADSANASTPTGDETPPPESDDSPGRGERLKMLEFLLCSLLTILPDYLFRRYGQGKRVGREITLFSVWFELRWGITLCLILTISLITTIFYFHPSTKAATSVFRTVTLLPEINGRVAETFVDINQRVEANQPLFRLDSTKQEAAVEVARRRIAEIEANMVVAESQLAEAEGRITQARGHLQQAISEFEARMEVQERSPGSISDRDVDRMRIQVGTAQGALDAAVASRDSTVSQIEFQLPAQKASAEAALLEAQADLDKTLVVAGTAGQLQQFALRPGDIANPFLRPAGVLVPERKITGLMAGFGQVEARVIKPGMIGEVACIAMPWQIVPVVVTQVQNVIAAGQVRPTDTLLDLQQLAQPGTITVILEPLYAGQLDDLPQGGSCIANAYTNNHAALQDPNLGTMKRIALHAVDTIGLVHAAILRVQALLMPVQNLVLGGH